MISQGQLKMIMSNHTRAVATLFSPVELFSYREGSVEMYNGATYYPPPCRFFSVDAPIECMYKNKDRPISIQRKMNAKRKKKLA